MFLPGSATNRLPDEPRHLLAAAESMLNSHPDVKVRGMKTFADGDTLEQRRLEVATSAVASFSIVDESRTDPNEGYPDEERRLAVTHQYGLMATKLSVEELVGHPEHGTGQFVHIVERGIDGKERQERARLDELTDMMPRLERTASFLTGILRRTGNVPEVAFVPRVDELTERCLLISPPESDKALEVGWQSLPTDGHDQDAGLVDRELGLFGVFDGMGSNKNSALAARLSAVVVRENLKSKAGQFITAEDRREAVATALHEAHVSIMRHKAENIDVGCTTGTVALVDEEDIAWASAGDTRLTAVYDDGTIEHVSRDEVDPLKGYLVTNILGTVSTCIKQSGVLPRVRADGARVVRLGFMSDGVTGDDPEDQWSDAAMIAAFSNSPAEAARQLVEDSTKIDDKFAIVVGL